MIFAVNYCFSPAHIQSLFSAACPVLLNHTLAMQSSQVFLSCSSKVANKDAGSKTKISCQKSELIFNAWQKQGFSISSSSCLASSLYVASKKVELYSFVLAVSYLRARLCHVQFWCCDFTTCVCHPLAFGFMVKTCFGRCVFRVTYFHLRCSLLALCMCRNIVPLCLLLCFSVTLCTIVVKCLNQ